MLSDASIVGFCTIYLFFQDFPSKGWLIRFSDVIGASHSDDYHFWRYNEVASTGLKQVAEFGATRMLESELKAQVKEYKRIIENIIEINRMKIHNNKIEIIYTNDNKNNNNNV